MAMAWGKCGLFTNHTAFITLRIGDMRKSNIFLRDENCGMATVAPQTMTATNG
jgi:hypothetical protein